jgi:ABC-type molybdate transport system substrate-binding protein
VGYIPTEFVMRKAMILLILCLFCPAVRGEVLSVSAAISLQEVLIDISRQYEEKTGQKVELNFGASGQLETQIRKGAAVDWARFLES